MGASCFSVSGNPAVVRSPAATTIRNMKVHFLPAQEGSGNPSPENVRDTHGWSSINAYQSGMNLLPFDDVLEEGWTDTVNGVTATYSHGIMTITGTHTESTWTTVLNKSSCWSDNPIILPPGTYCFPKPSGTYVTRDFCIRAKIDGATTANVSYTFTAHESVEITGFYFAVRGEGSFDCTVPVMFSPGTVRPTEYKPYVPIKTIPIEMKTIGKNLVHTKYPSRTANGITFTVNADWTITVNGTATAQTWLCPGLTGQMQYHTFLRAGTYFMSGGKSSSKAAYLAGRYVDGTVFSTSWDEGNGKLYVFTKDVWVYPQICISNGTTVNNETFSIQLERGDSASAFEPYSETAQTVYGGYVDPSNGKIVVEYIKIAPTKEEFGDLYTSGVGYRQTTGKYLPTASGVIWSTARSQQTLNKGRISNPYSESTYGDYTGVVFTMESSTSTAYARISEALYQTLEAGETVEFTYKLATPITYDIPLNGWNVLRGESVYWSDAIQDIDVTYDVSDSSEMMKARKRVIANNPKPITSIPQDINANSFDTDMRSYLKDCAIMFYPVQEGTGNPSPTNIRPIIGKNILRLRHTGKNMFPIIGFSASTASSKAVSSYALTNNYGTSIDTVFGSSGQVVVTQSETPLPETKSSYRNGYVCFTLDGIEFDKTYMLSFDITDITSNPLNASLSDIIVYSPRTVQDRITIDGNRLVYTYQHLKNTSHPERCSIEIRNCGMSFTLKNIMISDINNSDYTYEPYVPIVGKNIAKIMGYSATTGGNSVTNSYGTSLSTVKFSGPDTPLIVTQSQAPETSNPQHYRNGYFCIDVNGLEFGKSYSVSFCISDIRSNPLNATLNDIRVCDPYGSHYAPTSLSNGRIVVSNFKYDQNQNSPKITSIDIRNCGMSFTISEFMVTEVGVDQTYEPCVNNTYYVEMPYIGRNLFPCREEDMISDGWNRYFPNPFPEAGTYTISCTAAFGGTGDKGCALAFKDAPNNQAAEIGDHYLSYTFGSSTATTSRKRTFTITQEQANASYIAFFMMSNGSTYETFKNANIQIERGSTKTFYTPYNDNTIYGAAVDIVHGIVAVTHMYTELSAVNRYENANYFFTTAGELAIGNIDDTNAGLMCNRLNPKINTTETDTDPVISFYHNNIIRWVDPDYLSVTSANDYNDATAGNRVKIVYQLADPIFVQIEPQQIKSLLGNNTFSAEGNSIVGIRYWTH